eukprot:GHVT01053144.1.p3 GENE.GHVT01053144.1~~GHVT01053144.1.p3  ORF type:complete len:135 (-),score=8.30 GHVT01053144.1:1205-1609(-)
MRFAHRAAKARHATNKTWRCAKGFSTASRLVRARARARTVLFRAMETATPRHKPAATPPVAYVVLALAAMGNATPRAPHLSSVKMLRSAGRSASRLASVSAQGTPARTHAETQLVKRTNGQRVRRNVVRLAPAN